MTDAASSALPKNRANPPEVTRAPDGMLTFARAWAKAVTGTSYLPMTQTELEQFLLTLTYRMARTLNTTTVDANCDKCGLGCGHQIGTDLVAAHLISAEGLGRTIETISLRLVQDLGLTGADLPNRMSRLLGSIACGYTSGVRQRTLTEQESIRRAAVLTGRRAAQALRDSEARFRHQATHDPLTGLPNRALFTDRLTAVFDTPVRPDRRIGLCFVDLDGFKIVNDALGHRVGDLLLALVAERLREAVSRPLVARLGGDEFVILLDDSKHTEDAVQVAKATLATLAGPFLVDGHEVSVSASVGVVERPVAGSSPGEVMRDADVTLHWAKAAGKNRWALFDAKRNARELARYELAGAMPGALHRDEFFLDYQPLTSLKTGVVVGVEALVRWRHPRLGLLGPNRFIGLAEETGLIVRLGGWVLAEACEQAHQWYVHSHDCPFVSVNLAVRQVRDPSLLELVTGVLKDTGLPPDKLQLELTESALMSSADEPIHTLRTLAELGVRIAIDDFGTGYSNLAYLRELPVCELKVAAEFVTGLNRPVTDPSADTDEQIVVSLVSLAHALGLTVTAEGVETVTQAQRLRAIGCDTAQGWYFGRPGHPRQILSALPASSAQ